MSPISSRKERAAGRLLEAADAAVQRAGEGAALMPEELALDQLARDGGHVDRDEGPPRRRP
jgi:hypothetical protein